MKNPSVFKGLNNKLSKGIQKAGILDPSEGEWSYEAVVKWAELIYCQIRSDQLLEIAD